MAEYIEREKFRKHMREITNDPNCPMHIAVTVEQYIDEEPAADVEPVVHGRWIDSGVRDEDGNGEYTCSRCNHNDKHSPGIRVPYCWFCGAKMDGDHDPAGD